MGYPFPIEGSVGTTPILVYKMHGQGDYKLPSYIESVLLENTHDTQILYVSFDGGKTWTTLYAGDGIALGSYSARLKRGLLEEIQIKGSGAATTYEGILSISEPECG